MYLYNIIIQNIIGNRREYHTEISGPQHKVDWVSLSDKKEECSVKDSMNRRTVFYISCCITFTIRLAEIIVK